MQRQSFMTGFVAGGPGIARPALKIQIRQVCFTPARSFRPFPPLSKVPFLGKRKQRQQWGGHCAPGTLWPCATERAGSGQPTQCAHRSCRETRNVAGYCAKAAQAAFPRRGRPRPRNPRHGFGRRSPLTNIGSAHKLCHL